MSRSAALASDLICSQDCWTGVLANLLHCLECSRHNSDAKRTRCGKGRQTSNDSCASDASTVDTLPEWISGSPSHRSGPCSDSDIESCSEDEPKCSALRREVGKSMYEATEVQPWVTGNFELVRTLQTAERNYGIVDLMQSIDNGKFVAVKRMPNTWVRDDPEEFVEMYGHSSEQPWLDLGIARLLQKQAFPYVCEPLGVFRDEYNTYVVSSYATEGDLFTWCDNLPKAGNARTEAIKPIANDMFSAVKRLHDLGIAHCDLSLENIVVTRDDDGSLQVKLIDFGLAGLARKHTGQVRAKPSYQAPETHMAGECDRFLADSFALGVVLYAMAAHDYPWLSTKPGACGNFSNCKKYGVRNSLEQRRLQVDGGEKLLVDVLPESLVDTIVGLTVLRPRERLTLGEQCLDADNGRNSVWDSAWLTCEA